MQTRWAIVARLLTQRITDGEYPVGTVLPKELALADQFGVSRSTMRAALDELQKAGLISRRRNAGTRVEALEPLRGPASYNQTLATVEDVVQFGAQTNRVVQEIASEPAEGFLATLLQCAPGQTWLRVSSVRSPLDGAAPPLCWTDVYICETFALLVTEKIGNYVGLIATLIEEFTGHRAEEIRQTITATRVPNKVATALCVKPTSNALEITRQYLDVKQRVFIVSRSIHPADRYSYETRLQRQPLSPITRATRR